MAVLIRLLCSGMKIALDGNADFAEIQTRAVNFHCDGAPSRAARVVTNVAADGALCEN